MIPFILAAAISQAPPNSEELVNQFCSRVVGVEYGTDNITMEEFWRFTYCKENLILEKSN